MGWDYPGQNGRASKGTTAGKKGDSKHNRMNYKKKKKGVAAGSPWVKMREAEGRGPHEADFLRKGSDLFSFPVGVKRELKKKKTTFHGGETSKCSKGRS